MVFILNAAPGCGKTSVMNILQYKLPKGYAFIDGDDVCRLSSAEINLEWLNLMQDNIVACAKNYYDYGNEHIIICFVFPSKERFERLKNLLEMYSLRVAHIVMSSEEQEVERRIRQRNTQKLISIERALECNKNIKLIKADFSIDTTYIQIERVADDIYDFIIKTTSDPVILS
jgi:gluconate kinase